MVSCDIIHSRCTKLKYKKDDIVKGKVTGIENYGIFVMVDKQYSGLIHISEMSEKFVKNVFDYVELGENVKVKVLEVDDKNKKMKLSIKNIEYKMENKNELEDKNGFSSLRTILPYWIKSYKK